MKIIIIADDDELHDGLSHQTFVVAQCLLLSGLSGRSGPQALVLFRPSQTPISPNFTPRNGHFVAICLAVSHLGQLFHSWTRQKSQEAFIIRDYTRLFLHRSCPLFLSLRRLLCV